MKKRISLIVKKITPFCLFLLACSSINSTEAVRVLPSKYYVPKKTTNQLSKKTSDIIAKLHPKFFIIQSKEGSPMEVPQNILELSHTIKEILKDLGYTSEIPIPLELNSRDT